MAKLNDMPELNSAKVFLTNHFPREHLKPPRQYPATIGKSRYPHRLFLQAPLQDILPIIRHKVLPAQHVSCLLAALPWNSGMNGFTVYGFRRNSNWLKDGLMGFAKKLDKSQS